MSKSKTVADLIARREALKLVVASAVAAPLVGFGSNLETAAKPARPTTDPECLGAGFGTSEAGITIGFPEDIAPWFAAHLSYH